MVDIAERSAELHDRLGFTSDRDSHVHRELLGHPDEIQVHVHRPALDRIHLDAVDERGQALLAVDGDIDQRGGTGVAAEEIEFVGVDRDGGRAGAGTEQHGRQATLAAETGDLLAEDVPTCGGETRAGGGHRVGTS